jgi:palmitoyltransferase
VPARYLIPTGRHSLGIAIIVIHSLLVAMIAAVGVRLGTTVIYYPGFVPLGSPPKEVVDQLRKKQPWYTFSKADKNEISFDRAAIVDGRQLMPPGLEDFASRDVYVCEPDGLPPFCKYCWNWKPDRTHHNKTMGRCVRRFDHFCPWYVPRLLILE